MACTACAIFLAAAAVIATRAAGTRQQLAAAAQATPDPEPYVYSGMTHHQDGTAYPRRCRP